VTINITPLGSEQRDEAARVLARAFLTNPINIAVFGPNSLARNEAFFRLGLKLMKGKKLVAADGTRIVGVIHWVESPQCQVTTPEKIEMMPRMLSVFGLRTTFRVVSWLGKWAEHDPPERHSHLGPLGIEPQAQEQRVGRRLMEKYCEELDKEALDGYLETDKLKNVAFYQHVGFETTGTMPVLSVTNYFMQRKPRSR